MSVLTNLFVGTVRKAAENDKTANTVLFAIAVSLFVLAPVGATLKRWHHHQSLGPTNEEEPDHMGGCLFNPILYFCLTALIFATVNAFILERVYGRKEPDGNVFVTSIFVGIGLMILHTALVYRYFSPPKRAPRFAFMRSKASAFIGDAFLFTNMVLFQLLWNLLTLLKVPHPSGPVDFVLRALLLLFLALLLYFPPRMFYLADDIGKRRTWLMILLANSPILVKFLIGTDSAIQW